MPRPLRGQGVRLRSATPPPGPYMFGLGITELILILVIVLVIFGANRLPKLATGIGQSIKNFKATMRDDDAPKDKP